MRQSVRIVEQALEQMPDGPIVAEGLGQTLRPPPGEVYMRNETPRGEYGIYLVSKGAGKPYRLKIRSPAFCNLSAPQAMCLGPLQMRRGSMRVGPYGTLQSVADTIKLLAKEDLRPQTADRWTFELAPFVVVVPVFMAVGAVPFTGDLFVRNLGVA